LIDELVLLAGKKGAFHWRALGMMEQGVEMALSGDSAGAVHAINCGIGAYQSSGSTLMLVRYFAYLARAHAELRQFDDAWRSIDEGMSLIETTKERLWEAEVNRIAGEIALESWWHASKRRASSPSARPRTHGCASAAGKVLGTARGNEHGAALARSGQAG
jgi:hypothetical protein